MKRKTGKKSTGGTTTTSGISPIKLTTDQKKVYQSLVQFMSPEDMRTNAAMYGLKAPKKVPGVPREITGTVRNAYLSQQRAARAMNAISSTKVKGPGAVFLQNALSLLKKYGATRGEGMSRSSYNTFATQFSDMLNTAKSNRELQPYAALAQTFLSPAFSTGKLMDKTSKGYGSPAPKLYV